MKRLAYFMDVEWDYIKQRPNFVAEGLSELADVVVFHKIAKNRKVLSKNKRGRVRLFPILALSLRRKDDLLKRINYWYLRLLMGIVLPLFSPDLIVIPSPEWYVCVPKKYHRKLVYECMDDSLGLTSCPSERSIKLHREQQLLRDCLMCFATSESLITKLVDRQPNAASKVILNRNAFGGEILEDEFPVSPEQAGRIRIGYFGQVASWFDVKAVIDTVMQNRETEFHIYGPVTIPRECLHHDRVFLHGTIPHDELYETVRSMNILALPFVMCELVESVDPVKLYEYVNLGKPIVSSYWQEIQRFATFVDFYDADIPLPRVVALIIRNGLKRKYTSYERMQFLSENSWQARVAAMWSSICERS